MHTRASMLIAPLILILACGDDGPGPQPPDVVPPARISDLVVSSPPGRQVTLAWTATGDDGAEGRADAYDLRSASVPVTESSWDSSQVLPIALEPKAAGEREEFEVPSPPDGTWYFALRARDEAGNSSPVSNTVRAEVADAVAPAAVSDLRVLGATRTTVQLTWTAPGNDGLEGTAAAYDVRYSLEYITAANWNDATVFEGLPAPSAAGAHDSCRVEGLTTGQNYYFALRTADERPNWSPLSNVVSAAPVDGIPPAPIDDLRAVEVGPTSVLLTWTAPGDDDHQGRAAEYDLRTAAEPITHEIWPTALRVMGVPDPDSAGGTESFRVEGLTQGQLVYLAIRTADLSDNWSALSNVIAATPDVIPARQLTTNPNPSSSGAKKPAWSPDGTTIAFHADWSNPLARHEIYITPAIGGEPVQLTQDPAYDNLDPCWSPDGTRIALTSGPPIGTSPSGLRAMNADGSELMQLVGYTSHQLSHPAWSSDGRTIAYSVVRQIFWSWICLIDLDGGEPRAFTDSTQVADSPAWSPDGTQIAFASSAGGNTEIWIAAADGTGARQITTTVGGYADYPAWSRDGSRIALTVRRSNNSEIYVMASDGSDLRQLTFEPGSDEAPCWSPDGRQIAFTSNRTGSREIWVLDVPQ